MGTPITQRINISSPATAPRQGPEQLLPQSCALVAESLYASCSVLEAVVEDMCSRYSRFREIALKEFQRQKALGIRVEDSALDNRSQEYVTGLRDVVALGHTSASRCVETVRTRPDIEQLNAEARSLEAELEEMLRTMSNSALSPNFVAQSRKRPFSIFSAHRTNARSSELSLTPAVHRSLKGNRESLFRPSFQQDVSKLKMTPVLATAASIFRKEISATRAKGSSALIRNVPSLPSDNHDPQSDRRGSFVVDSHVITQQIDSDSSHSSECSDEEEEEEEEEVGHSEEEDEIEVRPSVEEEDSGRRKGSNDTDDEQDVDMASPLSGRPSEWADVTEATQKDALPEVEDHEMSSEGEILDDEEEEEDINEARDSGGPLVLIPPPPEPKTEPAIGHDRSPTDEEARAKTPLLTTMEKSGGYSLFKSPFLRLQKKLGVTSLFGGGTQPEETEEKASQNLDSGCRVANECVAERPHTTPHFAEDENVPPPESKLQSYHRFLRKLPPKKVEDNVPFPECPDDSRVTAEWARGGAWMQMVKSQKDINPYKLFGCGIRVVTFDAVFQTPDLRRAAHQAATELRGMRRKEGTAMSKDSRVRRWNNDRVTCGFSESEGMSRMQLDRMLQLLKKPRDVSHRAYEDWVQCELECNHDKGREQPWYKEV